MSVHQLTVADIAELRAAHVDVAVAEVADRHALDPASQAVADHMVTVMEADAARGFGILRQTAAMLVWSKLLMRALALHPLYEAATLGHLGEGVARNAYAVPLDLGHGRVQSARDAKGVRNRAAVATELVVDHLTRTDGPHDRLVSASLACGAAGPVYRLVDTIEGTFDGARVERIVLLDIDPMALASAASLARGTSAEPRLTLLKQNQLRPPLTGPQLPSHSVHIADALGLIEYLPERQAIDLLARVRTDLMAPGGLVVFGNMLMHRYQTEFLEHVVRWPRLLRRGVGTMLAILRAAGYDTDAVTVRITPDGVYAVYAARV